MKHYLKKLAIIIFLTTMLSGCYPTGERSLPSTDEMQSSVGKVSEKVGLTEFNYEISADLPVQAPRIKLKMKLLDKEKVKNVLLRGKTITSETKYRCDTEDGALLVVSSGIHFSEVKDEDKLKAYETVLCEYDRFCFSSEEQLESFPSKDAVERVNKILDELGVENYGEPYVVPITPEMANLELETHGRTSKHYGDDEYTLWTKDDGMYILKYKFNANGTDITNKGMKTLKEFRTVEGTGITAFVTKDYIAYIDVPITYELTVLNETADLKFGAAYASEQIIDRYTKLAPEDQMFFTDCKLEYVPYEYIADGEYIFTPAWCFSGYEIRFPDAVIPSHNDLTEYYIAETGIRYGSY